MKKLLLILAALALLGAGCVRQAPTSEIKKEATNTSLDPKTRRINMIPGGFELTEVEVEVGTNVVFENNDAVPRWPASGVHPTHELCPGFDPLGSVAPGSFYAHIFTDTKTCPFHDHLYPNMRGIIRVK